MDSLTHLVLGATLGEVLAGNKLGKRAMVIGAVVQVLPDIDVVASIWLDATGSLLAHRGFTHSIFFVALIVPLLVTMGKKWNAKTGMTNLAWYVFFAVQLSVHIFLDTFNVYGTGWLEPFSHERISFNVLFVADPLYTVWLLISTVILVVSSGNQSWRSRWASFGLFMSSLYLVLAISNKVIINHKFEKSLQQQSIQYSRYFSTPTPFNTALWFIVAEDNRGYHIGYRSVFDRQPFTQFNYYERNDLLITSIRHQLNVQQLIRFSEGYYVISQDEHTLLFNDLRFGQVEGWSNRNKEFIFRYDLHRANEDKMILQRGRFSDWDHNLVMSMWKRIEGN